MNFSDRKLEESGRLLVLLSSFWETGDIFGSNSKSLRRNF